MQDFGALSRSEEDAAFHEAGHAVMMRVFGREPSRATIVRDGLVFGYVDCGPITDGLLGRHFDARPEKRRAVNIHLLETVAGSVAHDLSLPGRQHDNADAHDLEHARQFLLDHAGWVQPEDRDAYLERLIGRASSILREHLEDVRKVATALLNQKTLDGAELIALCEPGTDADWEILY